MQVPPSLYLFAISLQFLIGRKFEASLNDIAIATLAVSLAPVFFTQNWKTRTCFPAVMLLLLLYLPTYWSSPLPS